MKMLRFDQAIPTAQEILRRYFGNRDCRKTLIRDAFGSITVVLPDDALVESREWDELAGELDRGLGKYSPGESQVLLRQSDLIDSSDILGSADLVRLPEAPNTWLVDRLQTNQDWLREPLVAKPPLPTAVAFSIKGGVGRTTALALWAWSLARSGKSVVLVDLDLEAPGVAGLLLSREQLPDYGLVDWLTEALVGQAEERLLEDCLVDCELAHDQPGRIRILPAAGKNTREYINKLGRVYMPTFDNAGEKFVGLAERLLMLLNQLAAMSDKPDLVLLDSRAGLHDIGSAAVTRLGAEVFLFARDDYQTWQAYRHLFKHLSNSRSVAIGMGDADLRWRLKMVGAQIEPTGASKLRLTDSSYAVWSDELYDEDVSTSLGAVAPSAQLFEREDDNAPHSPLFIQFDSRVRSFDLITAEDRPDWSIIETAFGEFFAGASARLLPNEMTEGMFGND